jgi:hypothetical protein
MIKQFKSNEILPSLNLSLRHLSKYKTRTLATIKTIPPATDPPIIAGKFATISSNLDMHSFFKKTLKKNSKLTRYKSIFIRANSFN